MDVVPVAGNGDSENEDDDYDEADILQPSVWRGRSVRLWRLRAGR